MFLVSCIYSVDEFVLMPCYGGRLALAYA